MEWLLGGGAAAGIVGMIALSLVVARMAHNNRGDLRELISVSGQLAKAQSDVEGYNRTLEDLQNALNERTDELNGERAARRVAEEALLRANQILASNIDARGVAHVINSALGRLQQMSPLRDSVAPGDHGDTKGVHGRNPSTGDDSGG